MPAISFGFSLGDVDLKSNLGEPLNARISINDTDVATIDPSCFSVTDASEVQAFKRAVTSLNSNSNQLIITSSQVISEPIINLSVTYHCEPRVNREYVLLLDPAPTPALEVAKSTPSNVSEKTAASANLASPGTAKTKINNAVSEDPSNGAEETPPPPVKKKRAKKKTPPKAASSIDAKLDEAYTGKQTPSSPVTNPSQPEANPTNTSEKPYLVISGGNTNASENGSQANLALRMERQLDLNRVETAEAPLTTAEAMDEVTVMANRLAHLEKQILSLQTQNQQLQAEAEKAKDEGFHIPPAVWSWLRYLGIAALVIIALAIIEMLRRKLLSKRLARTEPIWFDSEHDAAADTDAYADITNQANKLMADPLFGEAPAFGAAPAQSTLVNQPDNDEAESVLEHADVFIAHGRSILAIQLLQNHLADAPTQSPTIWLKLLSLLANEGSETEYDVAVIECNQYFNIKLPSFADAHTPDHSSIEDHPHIVDRLEGAWGSAFAITLLNDLIYNQHSQPREGFARGTFEELFFLKKIAEILQSSDTVAKNPQLTKPQLVSSIAPLASATAVTAESLLASEAAQTASASSSANQNLAITQSDAALTIDDASSLDDGAEASTAAKTNTIDWPAHPQQDNAPTALNETHAQNPQISVDYAIDFESDISESDVTPAGSSSSLNSTSGLESEWQTPAQADFQVSEIDYASPDLDVASIDYGPVSSDLPGLDLNVDEPNPVNDALHDQAEAIQFETDFADDLDFDQAELAQSEGKLEIDPDEENNSIDFDWDLPKINKD
jgi:hypothetical protein